jgi:hypothetical protein
MAWGQITGSRARRALLGAATALVPALGVAPAVASANTVSSNWAGYVALPSSSGQQGFTSVSGSWRVPHVTCSAGEPGYSAAWVGLGGYSQNSGALEQVGTDADCSRSGRAHYDSWFELIPAAPVAIGLRAGPGDEMTGSVTVRGHDVTLRLRDLTKGTHYSTTRRVSRVDTSSADWILEAPSSCEGESCETLPLSDFGTASFLATSATSSPHTGPLQDPHWSAVGLELRQGAQRGVARFADGRGQGVSLITATPSSVTGGLGAFTVTWAETRFSAEAPGGRTFGEGAAGERAYTVTASADRVLHPHR